jgi:hypothetical protein
MGIEIRDTGDGYAFDVPGGISIEIERLNEDSGGLTGEITIGEQRDTGVRLLHSARLNLMSTQSRSGLCKALSTACEGVKWQQTIEEVCYLARNAHREGDQLIEIGRLPPRGTPRWMVRPYLGADGPTLLFGDGGTGKSFFALAFAAQIAGGFSLVGTTTVPPSPVLYLDWETDQYTHDQRLKAICKAIDRDPPPNVFYRRQTASLEASASHLKREIVKRGIAFAVIDSMAAARGGEPESADVTVRLFNAARSLGIPWLGVDHITKAAGANGDAKKPFGSVFAHNLARMTWGAEADQNEGEIEKGILLTNHKSNNGKLQPKATYRLVFHTDDNDDLTGVDFKRDAASNFPKLAKGEDLGKRIIAALRTGRMGYQDIADELELPRQDIRVRTNQLVKAGHVIQFGRQRKSEFGLPERRLNDSE